MYSADPDGSIALNIICKLHGTWEGGAIKTGFFTSVNVDPDGNLVLVLDNNYASLHFAFVI